MSKIILCFFATILLSSCTMNENNVAVNNAPAPPKFTIFSDDAIYYVGAHNGLVVIFDNKAVALNAYTATAGFQAFGPVSYTEKDGIKCVTALSKPIDTRYKERKISYAIKRPIKLNETFGCEDTVFRVKKCFDSECEDAVIEILSGPYSFTKDKGYNSEYLIDDCLGIKILSNDGAIDDSLPLDAKFLHGRVGILASNDYPDCNPLRLHQNNN